LKQKKHEKNELDAVEGAKKAARGLQSATYRKQNFWQPQATNELKNGWKRRVVGELGEGFFGESSWKWSGRVVLEFWEENWAKFEWIFDFEIEYGFRSVYDSIARWGS
jgi:hypothetical protein